MGLYVGNYVHMMEGGSLGTSAGGVVPMRVCWGGGRSCLNAHTLQGGQHGWGTQCSAEGGGFCMGAQSRRGLEGSVDTAG